MLSPEAFAEYKVAYQCEKENRLLDAVEALKKVLNIDPTFTFGWRRLGYAYSYLSEWQDAIDAYEQALLLEPNNLTSMYCLATTYAAANAPEKAERLFRDVINLHPDEPVSSPAYHNLAVLLHNQARYREAEKSYHKAILGNLDFTQAYRDLGSMYYQEGRIQEAIDVLKAAISIQPDFFIAYSDLIAVLKESGREAEALALWQELLAVKQLDDEINEKWKKLSSSVQNTVKTTKSFNPFGG